MPRKELYLRIALGLIVALILYASFLRSKSESSTQGVGHIDRPISTVSYDAVTDFEISERDIFVPAYKDTVNDVLAVDPYLYKGSFGAADVVFAHPAGMYTLVLTTMKERVGESAYKILVDQKTWAFFKNDTTSKDSQLQEHRVENVYIAEDEVIQVQFNTHSNNKITDQGESAYSSGRWKSLQVTLDK